MRKSDSRRNSNSPEPGALMTQAQPNPHAGPEDRTTGRLAADHPVIKCVGLTKMFRDFWMRNRVRAVDGINLDVRCGEVFGLLGPNGSGKSTTIKLALGLLHPTAGRVFVFDRRPDDVAIKRRIGYLPEESYLYRFLNARETLDYYGRLFFQSRSQRRKRIDMLLDMVGLTAVQRRPVGEYSKGMQRRIGLAQALINDPDLLILDEPTTGMDPIGTRQIKDLIFELAQRGKTVVLCSHLLADVEDVCDRVAIMFGGKIRKEGTVDELLVRAGRTTIETGALDVDTIQQIEQLLETRGQHVEKVEQPRQRLEQLFLDIVQEAMAEGASTSGAEAGGRIAQFLTEGTQGVGESGSNLVDKLMDEAPGEAAPAARPVITPAETGPDREAIDQLMNADAAAGTEVRSGDGGGRDDHEPKRAEAPDEGLIESLLNESTKEGVDGGDTKR